MTWSEKAKLWFECRRTVTATLAASNLAHCWPLLVSMLTQYSNNDRIAEKTGRAIKQALQSSGKASAAMLLQVSETVAQQFQQSRHPCMLYIASELLKTFGADQQFQAPLGEHARTVCMLISMCCKAGTVPMHAHTACADKAGTVLLPYLQCMCALIGICCSLTTTKQVSSATARLAGTAAQTCQNVCQCAHVYLNC